MEVHREPSLGELLEFQTNTISTSKGKRISHELGNRRANKNRPREQSSKMPVKPTISNMRKNLTKSRDPRFDNLCGEYNEHFFRESYSFVEEIKRKEKEELEEILKEEKNPTRKSQIKYLLKRFKDQERENEKKNLNAKKKYEQSKKLKENLLAGKHVHFQTKSEKKLADLVEKYEELKSKGKVQSYLKKKFKKNKRHPEDTPF